MAVWFWLAVKEFLQSFVPRPACEFPQGVSSWQIDRRRWQRHDNRPCQNKSRQGWAQSHHHHRHQHQSHENLPSPQKNHDRKEPHKKYQLLSYFLLKIMPRWIKKTSQKFPQKSPQSIECRDGSRKKGIKTIWSVLMIDCRCCFQSVNMISCCFLLHNEPRPQRGV